MATGIHVTERLASSPATLYPVATYDSNKQRITYPDGTTLAILALTANTLTVSSSRQVAATGSLSDPLRKLVTEKYYAR